MLYNMEPKFVLIVLSYGFCYTLVSNNRGMITVSSMTANKSRVWNSSVLHCHVYRRNCVVVHLWLIAARGYVLLILWQ